MARCRRDRRDPNNRVIHVTNRVWKGLPFVQNIFVNRLILGILAKGQTLYPVKIVCMLFMGNHYHFILAGDANRVSNFLAYINGEIARSFMRLMPHIWGPKFWQGRYKEQHLATPEDVIKKIAYICGNPVRAGLVLKFNDYPGISSINDIFRHDHKTSALWSFAYLRHLKRLKYKNMTHREAHKAAQARQLVSEVFFELKTDLFAWIKCFKKFHITKEEALKRIKSKILLIEDECKNKTFVGAEKLRLQSFFQEHTPKKSGRSVFVECHDNHLRLELMDSYHYFCYEAGLAWHNFKNGYEAIWPRGAVLPSHAKAAKSQLRATG